MQRFTYLTGNPFRDDTTAEVEIDILDYMPGPREIAEARESNPEMFEVESRVAWIDEGLCPISFGQHSLGHQRLAWMAARSLENSVASLRAFADALDANPELIDLVLS